jgi:hypothetical protein
MPTPFVNQSACLGFFLGGQVDYQGKAKLKELKGAGKYLDRGLERPVSPSFDA